MKFYKESILFPSVPAEVLQWFLKSKALQLPF